MIDYRLFLGWCLAMAVNFAIWAGLIGFALKVIHYGFHR
jgi:hypothetical protein